MSDTKPREGPSFIPRNFTVSLLTSCNQNGVLWHVTDIHRCFMLLTPHIFLHTMYQPTTTLSKIQQNTNNKTQFMTSITLLRVSAWGCHSGAETCRSLILVMDCILWFLFYCVLSSASVCWCIECTGVPHSAEASSSVCYDARISSRQCCRTQHLPLQKTHFDTFTKASLLTLLVCRRSW